MRRTSGSLSPRGQEQQSRPAGEAAGNETGPARYGRLSPPRVRSERGRSRPEGQQRAGPGRPASARRCVGPTNAVQTLSGLPPHSVMASGGGRGSGGAGSEAPAACRRRWFCEHALPAFSPLLSGAPGTSRPAADRAPLRHHSLPHPPPPPLVPPGRRGADGDQGPSRGWCAPPSAPHPWRAHS